MSTPDATPQPPEVKAVLFDYGLVLSGPPNADAWTRLQTLTGLNAEQLHQHYWSPRHDYDRGTYTGEAYFQQIAESSGRPLFDAVTTRDLLNADTDLWTDVNQPMLDWAHSLKRRGLRIGILSNLGDAMHAGVARKLGWVENFDHCTWSYRLKLAKPEAEIYRSAAEGLETEPAHILFVDDKQENVLAAQQFGMQAVQFTTYTNLRQQLMDRSLGALL